MLKRFTFTALTVASLGVAACGSGSTGTTSSQAGAGTLAVVRSRPTRMYKVALSGRAEAARGAPQGRGFAIIAFHGPSLVCWRFAHLHGFTAATGAGIVSGAVGKTGRTVVALSGGPHLHHQGCATMSPATTKTIWKDPGGYYVNVLSAGYPRGAVRSQL